MTTNETIHVMKSGRFIVAHWNSRQCQWQSSNIKHAPFQGYQYTFGRSLEALAAEGIKTYSTRANARRAARSCYGEEG